MTLSFGGVGSGLPVTDWIEAMMQAERKPVDKLYTDKSRMQTAQSTLNTVSARFTSLRSTIQKLTDSRMASSLDLFKSRKVSTSEDTLATASVSHLAVPQNVKLKIESLATSTIAKSKDESMPGVKFQVGQNVAGSELITSLANGQGKTGKFSMVINGTKQEFTVGDTSTLDSVISDVNTFLNTNGGSASIVDGKVVLDAGAGNSLTLGSSSDTSNFFNITKLSTAEMVGTAYTSVGALTSINTSKAIVSADSHFATAVAAGSKFKIGNAEFTIDAETSLDSLIAKINNSKDAGVVAQFDYNSNKMVLTAKEAGKTLINLENLSGNFLDAVGLNMSASTSTTGSQKLGTNAKVYLNESTTALEVTSNKLTADVTGIAGLTVELKKADATKTIDLNITRDTDSLVNAINAYVGKYNEMATEVDKQTKNTKDEQGNLKGEYSLIRMKNDIRQITMGSVSGLSKYNNLAAIGISTGAVGTSVGSDTSKLAFDQKKFMEAMEADPDAVRTLLIGNDTGTVKGVFQNLREKVDGMLDPVNGYFASRKKTMTSSIMDMDKSIERSELRLAKRKETLTRQFTEMDKYISQMKSQNSSLAMYGF